MKKIYGLIILLVIIFILPIKTFAVDYTIDEMDIDVELKEDGDVFVTENQTYTFESEFNGITRVLIPKEGTDIVNVEARENNEDLKIEQDDTEYKIHRKGENETVTIELSYLIEDGLTIYSDVAEFAWPFFDTNNESDYEQFEVTVSPPQQTNDVIAFGDDSAMGSEHIQENGDVRFDLGNVSSGEKGDIKVAYDANLFPKAEVSEDILMREEIESEKQALKDKQIAFEKRRNTLDNIVPYILGVLGLLFIGLLLFAFQQKQTIKNEVNRKFPLPYFVPEEIMSLPATIFYKKSNIVTPEVLSAALMDLIRKRYVEELEEETFKVVNRETTHEHELLLIQWLFDEIGDGNEFTIKDIENYTAVKKNQKTYQKKFLEWQKAVQKEETSHNLFVQNIKLRVITGIIGLLIIPGIIYIAIYDLLLYMAFSIFLSIGYLLFAAFYKTRTILGEKISRDWQVFQDKYPEMTDEDWTELTTNDQKRAFIYGVGIKNRKIEKTNENMLTRFSEERFTISSPVYYLTFAAVFNNSFNDAQTTSASSAPSAGGGTGVGGGGGGSGAF